MELEQQSQKTLRGNDEQSITRMIHRLLQDPNVLGPLSSDIMDIMRVFSEDDVDLLRKALSRAFVRDGNLRARVLDIIRHSDPPARVDPQARGAHP